MNMPQLKLQLNFNPCIIDKIEFPKNDKWIYDLKKDREKTQKDIQWVLDLIDKYSA